MATGQFNKVPLMQGGTSNEGMFRLGPRYDGAGMPVTAMQYPALLQQNFGASRVAAIQEQYPLSDYPTPSYAFIQAMSDFAAIGQQSNRGMQCACGQSNRFTKYSAICL